MGQKGEFSGKGLRTLDDMPECDSYFTKYGENFQMEYKVLRDCTG